MDAQPRTYEARQLRYQLEATLEEHRSRKPIIPDFDFADPNFLEECEKNLENAYKRTNNLVIMQHYIMGMYLHQNPTKMAEGNQVHRASLFIARYFDDEADAIFHLEKVSTWQFSKISRFEQEAVIRCKTPKQDPTKEVTCDSPQCIPQDQWLIQPEEPQVVVQEELNVKTGELWEGVPKRSESPPTWEFLLRDFDKYHSDWARTLDPPITTSKKRSFSYEEDEYDFLLRPQKMHKLV